VFVGTALAELELPAGGTLKDKRRVVRSVLARLRRRFLAACAEVGRLEDHHRAALGVAVVGNDHRHVQSVLNTIESYLAGLREAVLLDFDSQIL
jgi:uncharacterized protein